MQRGLSPSFNHAWVITRALWDQPLITPLNHFLSRGFVCNNQCPELLHHQNCIVRTENIKADLLTAKVQKYVQKSKYYNPYTWFKGNNENSNAFHINFFQSYNDIKLTRGECFHRRTYAYDRQISFRISPAICQSYIAIVPTYS